MDFAKRKIGYNFRRLNSLSTQKFSLILKDHGYLKPHNYLSMSNGCVFVVFSTYSVASNDTNSLHIIRFHLQFSDEEGSNEFVAFFSRFVVTLLDSTNHQIISAAIIIQMIHSTFQLYVFGLKSRSNPILTVLCSIQRVFCLGPVRSG